MLARFAPGFALPLDLDAGQGGFPQGLLGKSGLSKGAGLRHPKLGLTLAHRRLALSAFTLAALLVLLQPSQGAHQDFSADGVYIWQRDAMVRQNQLSNLI